MLSAAGLMMVTLSKYCRSDHQASAVILDSIRNLLSTAIATPQRLSEKRENQVNSLKVNLFKIMEW